MTDQQTTILARMVVRQPVFQWARQVWLDPLGVRMVGVSTRADGTSGLADSPARESLRFRVHHFPPRVPSSHVSTSPDPRLSRNADHVALNTSQATANKAVFAAACETNVDGLRSLTRPANGLSRAATR